MNIREVTDRKGRKFQWDDADGYGWFLEMSKNFTTTGLGEQMKQVKNMELRDDDVIICTFPKSGSHWVREIVSMVLKGKAEYENSSALAAMIEARSPKFLSSLSSPRTLCTHVYASCLPYQATEKNIRIIGVFRHPKDIAVSYFYHMQKAAFVFEEPPYETFSEFLPYVTGEYDACMIVSLFRYLNEFEIFVHTNPSMVLNLYFEELKIDLEAAVKKIADFLGKYLTPDVVKDIADKCSFKNLKKAEETKVIPEEVTAFLGDKEKEKLLKQGRFTFLRKGEVGDWKNHFSVAESEKFDNLLEEQLKDNQFWKHYH